MTAIRIIESHFELEDVGQESHARIDEVLAYLTGSETILLVSASSILSGARTIAGGPGVSITDAGPGGILTISFTATGSGDVVGPAAAEDNGVARFDGITGKLLTGSLVFIDDAGNVDVPSGSLRLSGSLYVTGNIHSPEIMPAGSIDPVSPSTGTIYFNTDISELVAYDGGRGKWLSVSKTTLQVGRNGNTPPGQYYRGVDGMVLDDETRSIPVPAGTLTSLGWSKTDSNNCVLEILVNGSQIESVTHSTSGSIFRTDLNADFSSGSMSFRNSSGGEQAQNVQVVAEIRRRTS